MRRRDANAVAKGLFGDAGLAWEEYDSCPPSTDENLVFKVGFLDENSIYHVAGESVESYADAFERAVESVS